LMVMKVVLLCVGVASPLEADRYALKACASRRRRGIRAAMSEPPFLAGQLLLAMPGMADPRFDRSVIAICVHDENGAVGIGIGHKRAGLRFRDLLKQLDLDAGEAPDCAIHHGGPVEPGRGFVLHSTDWGGEDTLQVNAPGGKEWAMTGTVDILRAIAEGRGPAHWSVALGYAGWGPGQLEEEMTRHGWFAAPGDPKLLFETPTDERWATAFRSAGIDPRLLSSETGVA
jgi:putative transcriptional regulator